MGVVGQRHAPAALHPGKTPGTHCIGNWVGHRGGLDGCEKSRPPLGFDPRTVHNVASRCTDAIPVHFRDNVLDQTSRFRQSKTLGLLEDLKMGPRYSSENFSYQLPSYAA